MRTGTQVLGYHNPAEIVKRRDLGYPCTVEINNRNAACYGMLNHRILNVGYRHASKQIGGSTQGINYLQGVCPKTAIDAVACIQGARIRNTRYRPSANDGVITRSTGGAG